MAKPRLAHALSLVSFLSGKRARPSTQALASACTALEKSCDADIAAIDAGYTAKARRLQQDRATVEARVQEWVHVAERIVALLHESEDVLMNCSTRSLEQAQVCAEGLKVLDQKWQLRCGHAGAPWLSISESFCCRSKISIAEESATMGNTGIYFLLINANPSQLNKF